MPAERRPSGQFRVPRDSSSSGVRSPFLPERRGLDERVPSTLRRVPSVVEKFAKDYRTAVADFYEAYCTAAIHPLPEKFMQASQAEEEIKSQKQSLEKAESHGDTIGAENIRKELAMLNDQMYLTLAKEKIARMKSELINSEGDHGRKLGEEGARMILTSLREKTNTAVMKVLRRYADELVGEREFYSKIRPGTALSTDARLIQHRQHYSEDKLNLQLYRVLQAMHSIDPQTAERYLQEARRVKYHISLNALKESTHAPRF